MDIEWVELFDCSVLHDVLRFNVFLCDITDKGGGLLDCKHSWLNVSSVDKEVDISWNSRGFLEVDVNRVDTLDSVFGRGRNVILMKSSSVTSK